MSAYRKVKRKKAGRARAAISSCPCRPCPLRPCLSPSLPCLCPSHRASLCLGLDLCLDPDPRLGAELSPELGRPGADLRPASDRFPEEHGGPPPADPAEESTTSCLARLSDLLAGWIADLKPELCGEIELLDSSDRRNEREPLERPLLLPSRPLNVDPCGLGADREPEKESSGTGLFSGQLSRLAHLAELAAEDPDSEIDRPLEAARELARAQASEDWRLPLQLLLNPEARDSAGQLAETERPMVIRVDAAAPPDGAVNVDAFEPLPIPCGLSSRCGEDPQVEWPWRRIVSLQAQFQCLQALYQRVPQLLDLSSRQVRERNG